MKIDSCLIIKNEENTIENLINQLLQFSHEVHITDTGSTDKTLEIIETLQKTYKNLFLHHFEWVYDFSKARNYSLYNYDCLADYQFWCDGDDELNEQLLKTLIKFSKDKKTDADIYYVKYQYFVGDPAPHFRTSLLKVDTHLEWNDPIHEYIQPTTAHKLDTSYFDNGSLIIHHKQKSHNSRNIDIFFNMEKTHYNFSARNLYYYGNELKAAGLNKYSYFIFKQCVNHDEVSLADATNACINMYKLWVIKENNIDDDWVDNAFHLIKIGKTRGDLYYFIGDYFYNKNQLIMAKHFYLIATTYKFDKNSLDNFLLDANNLTVNPYLQLGVIYWKLGDSKKCIDYNNLVLTVDPENQIAKKNLEILSQNK